MPSALESAGCTLAGAPNLAFMAGSGAPCPEGKPLKARRPVSLAGYQLPAAGRSGYGLDKPISEHRHDHSKIGIRFACPVR